MPAPASRWRYSGPLLPALAAGGALQLGAWIGLTRYGGLEASLVGSGIVLVVAGCAWALSLLVAEQRPASSAPRLWSWVLVFAVGLGARWLVLGAVPNLTDDYWRYAYEGCLVLEGESPYAHAPADPERDSQRERWPVWVDSVGHPQVSAAYPPVAQAIFAGVMSTVSSVTVVPPQGSNRPDPNRPDSNRPDSNSANSSDLDSERGPAASPAAGPAATELQCSPPPAAKVRGVLRGAATWADLSVWIVLALASNPARRMRVAIGWGWSPLVLLAFAGSGHFDVYGILALWLGLWVWGAGSESRLRSSTRRIAAGLLFGIGVGIKFLPVLPLLTRGRSLRVSRAAAFASTAAGSLWVLALIDGDQGLFRGLSNYSERWSSTNLLFRWIEKLSWWSAGQIEGLSALGWFEPEGPLGPHRLARLAVVLLFLGAWAKTRRERIDARATTGALLGSFVLLTPTLHPWYLCWWLPFAVDRGRVGPVLLMVVGPLLYTPVSGYRLWGSWQEPAWLWPFVLGPVTLLILVEVPWTLRASLERLGVEERGASESIREARAANASNEHADRR